jgi:hypothetical protein
MGLLNLKTSWNCRYVMWNIFHICKWIIWFNPYSHAGFETFIDKVYEKLK